MDKSALGETFLPGSLEQGEANEMLASMRGSLTLDANGTATETTNYKDKYIPLASGEHKWSGKWTHHGNRITVQFNEGTFQTFSVSPDGNTLTMPGWAYNKTRSGM